MRIEFGIYRFWYYVKVVADLQSDPWWVKHRNIGGVK
jgi:hypothetical protein